MSTVITQDTKLTRMTIFHVVLSVTVLVMLITMMISESADLQNAIQGEMAQTQKSLGNDSWKIIESRAKIRYKENYFDSGIYDMITKTFIAEKGDILSDVITQEDEIMPRVIDNMTLFAYQIAFRITVLEYWLVLFLPLSAAFIIHGFFEWKIKLYRMGGSSTGNARIWMKAFWVLFLSFVIVLFLPASFASTTVYSPVILILGTAFAVGRYVANFAKSF
jgi:hypothetical protein